ncbi:hypothetical protein NQ315_005652 [Exocentrus adspersus]|uniref:Nuclease HARBI1 n=1 Tax=Exocentrus adspersus TaxID=1586481 RepID=A0AAV8V708_9CUCU|nr:hypothetical protein NQ315_005652 [Exocentrus adspersus]
MSESFHTVEGLLGEIVMKSKKKALAMAIIYHEFIETRKHRTKWEKNWLKNKSKYGHLNLPRELRLNDPNDFKNYLRMDCGTFDELLNMLRPYLTRQDTRIRRYITAESRLTATLRYLATGRGYEDLKFSTVISAQALGYIIPETCRTIYEVLRKKYMRFPSSEEEWKNIFKNFKDLWDVPNCRGAIDRKHIRIHPPHGTGAMYYNYKGFYSIVLMANATREFIYVDCNKSKAKLIVEKRVVIVWDRKRSVVCEENDT